jgi:hypothetical protein
VTPFLPCTCDPPVAQLARHETELNVDPVVIYAAVATLGRPGSTSKVSPNLNVHLIVISAYSQQLMWCMCQ